MLKVRCFVPQVTERGLVDSSRVGFMHQQKAKLAKLLGITRPMKHGNYQGRPICHPQAQEGLKTSQKPKKV